MNHIKCATMVKNKHIKNVEVRTVHTKVSPESSDWDCKIIPLREVKKEVSKEIFSASDDSADYEPYHCHCCSKQCHDKKRDFITSPGEEEDPPIIYQPKITSVESIESEVQFAAPKCQCANCALKNMCKSRQCWQ